MREQKKTMYIDDLGDHLEIHKAIVRDLVRLRDSLHTTKMLLIFWIMVTTFWLVMLGASK